MNIAAYCRVSTDKEDQLNSLETQKKFFTEYAKRTGANLVRLYADEGLSGTKIKNRKDFLRLMDDAEKGLFQQVVVKDISRFARNTVDLLQNVRKLKAMGIEMLFLTANMTSMGNSEFILTIFGALAQEESANTSKRIKFGKKVNMEKGRVPNLVYGYDKIPGNIFDLEINRQEAGIIQQIFQKYVEDGLGTSRIASELNRRGYRTKRGCSWSQNAICRILTNELYIGKIANGKQEVSDFLTSTRRSRDRSEWYISERPELSIIDQELFDKAQRIMTMRGQAFKENHERHSGKYLFSTLIKCKECGRSFRRIARKYKNTYVRWVCSVRNCRGTESCNNDTVVEERELIGFLQEFFDPALSDRRKLTEHIVKELGRINNTDIFNNERELKERLNKAMKTRRKYIEMYTDELITREELNIKIEDLNATIADTNNKLNVISSNILKSKDLNIRIRKMLEDRKIINDFSTVSNASLGKLIEKIEIGKNGETDIFFRHLSGERTQETVPDRNDCT